MDGRWTGPMIRGLYALKRLWANRESEGEWESKRSEGTDRKGKQE